MDIENNVKNYYGKVLKKSSDLKTDACCTKISYPENIKQAMKNIHLDITNSYYGCGLVIPDCLEGCNVLDLGCGTGRDVYLLSKFVGEDGCVVGIDMTEEQLEVAEKYKDYHKDKYGYSNSNVKFIRGDINSLEELNLGENKYDVIVSNCVINLLPNKEKVLSNIYKLLKVGGELYFSDVYSNKRIPQSLRQHDILWGECLSGALYWNDFINISKKVGFIDIRLVESNNINIRNRELEKLTGNIEFYSATYRLFKLPDILEPDCEDYGQAVIYLGTINNNEYSWNLDNHHRMQKGNIFKVCGNTWNMLNKTRFSKHFEFLGNFNTHYGIFDGCGKSVPFINTLNTKSSCC